MLTRARTRWARHGRKVVALLLVGGWAATGTSIVLGEGPSSSPVGLERFAAPMAAEASNAVSRRYIVLFKDSAFSASARSADRLASEVATLSASLAQRYRASLEAQCSHAVSGMAVDMDATAAAALAKDPQVLLVEEDVPVHARGVQSPAIWGLDRVDQRDLPLNNTYTYSNGGGVPVAVAGPRAVGGLTAMCCPRAGTP